MAMSLIRLDKYLADMKAGTRSEVKEYIRKGRVQVDEITVKKPEQKVDIMTQKVFLDGRMISYVTMEYYMLNKPSGVLTATMDKNAKTVLDLMDVKRKDLFPVGRLDKDTEGLLLITNDGELAHNLLAPKKHVDKTYYAKAAGRIREEAIKLFADGLHVDDEFTALPAKLELNGYNDKDNYTDVIITIHEGKFHQIKRMFEAVGSEVLYLKRLRMGSLVLDETLKPGEYRTLTQKEIDELYNCN